MQPRLINYSRRLPHSPPSAPASPPRFDQTLWTCRDQTPPLTRDSTSTLPSSDSGSSIFSNLDDAEDINWDLTSSGSGAPRLQMRRSSSSCIRHKDRSSKHVKAWLYDFPLPPLDPIEIAERYPHGAVQLAERSSPNNIGLAERSFPSSIELAERSSLNSAELAERCSLDGVHLAQRNGLAERHALELAENYPLDAVELAQKYPLDRPCTPLNVCKGTASKPHGQRRHSPPPPPPPPKDAVNSFPQTRATNNSFSSRDLPSSKTARKHVPPRLQLRKSIPPPSLHTSSPTLHEPAAIQKPRRAPPPPPPELVRDHLADYDPDLGMVVRSYWDDSDDEDEPAHSPLQRTRAVLDRVRALANTSRAGSSCDGSYNDARNTARPSRTSSRAESRSQVRAPSRAASRATSRPPSACGPTYRTERQILPLVAPPLMSYIAPRLTPDKHIGNGATIKSTSSSPCLLRRAMHRVAGSL